jgi:hypothetical protein
LIIVEITIRQLQPLQVLIQTLSKPWERGDSTREHLKVLILLKIKYFKGNKLTKAAPFLQKNLWICGYHPKLTKKKTILTRVVQET